MNKNQALLAAGCLLLGMFSCATDSGVQKGYLTPEQTAPSSEPTSASASSDTGSTQGERLPPPSVTQEVTAPAPDSSTSASTASASESPPASSGESSMSSSAESARSPSALAKNDQQPGGKAGAAGSSLRREEQANEEQMPEPQTSSREEERDEKKDEDAASPKKQSAPSAVSSSLSSGNTRILTEPMGSAKGVILKVNTNAKFVVIKFQYRAVPTVGKVLSVMRNGEKVGQIKMTKPIRSPHGTADIIEGDVQRGDTVE